MSPAANDMAARHWLVGALSPYETPPLTTPNSPDDWKLILQLADRWSVAGRLFDALKDIPDIPQPLLEHCQALTDLIDLRHGEMQQDLIQIIQWLNERGVEPILIKGASRLMGSGPPGQPFPMTDLDLWVPEPQEFEIAIRHLKARGFRKMCPDLHFDPAVDHHWPRLTADSLSSALELHQSPVHIPRLSFFDVQDALTDCALVAMNDCRFKVLSPEHAAALALIQCAESVYPWIDENKYQVSKWIECLERLKFADQTEFAKPDDFTLQADFSPVLRRVLTLWSDLMGLPYKGPRDTGLQKNWANAPSFLNSLKAILKPALKPRKFLSLKCWVNAPKIITGRVRLLLSFRQF
jgi:hypothetical protein